MLPYRDALDQSLALDLPTGSEAVPLLEASGRWLAEPVRAAFVLPRFDNSAMDGFAVRCEDVAGATEDAPVVLPIAGESAAGVPFDAPIPRGAAIRISTGAKLPEGADGIVPVEQAEVRGERVSLRAPARPGAMIRRAGEDVRQGEVLLAGGTRLDAVKVAAIGMFNVPSVVVRRRPKVAIFTSGDEIRLLGETLRETDVMGVNVYYLELELRALGCETRVLGVSPDREEDFRAMAREALAWGDLVVTAAGVSVGDHDVVGPVLDSLGAQVHFWKVAVRPGKPMLVATVKGKPWLGLPGNPVSVWANTEIFVKPLLRKALGARMIERPLVRMRLGAECPRDRARLFFVAARATEGPGGAVVEPLGRQSSGNLWNAARANAMIVLEPGEASVPAGEMVDVLRVEHGA